MKDKDIQEYVRKIGFLRAEYKGKYKDYKVYEPVYSDDKKLCCICEPFAILVKDNKIIQTDTLEQLNDIIENLK